MSDFDSQESEKAQNVGAMLVEREIRMARSLVAKSAGRGIPEEPVACNDCGDDIPVARLLAAPWTRRCVACQKFWEKSR